MEDEVDRLVEAWRRERPDLDVTPLFTAFAGLFGVLAEGAAAG